MQLTPENIKFQPASNIELLPVGYIKGVIPVVDTLTIAGTGGNYTISVNVDGAGVQTTGPLAFNANAATIQAALRALSNVGSPNVVVTGTGPYVLDFSGGALAQHNVVVTLGVGALTGGGATITAAPTGFALSNIDGFANGQGCTVIFPDGKTYGVVLAATAAVDKLNKTVTLLSTPILPTTPAETTWVGATILGPTVIALGGTSGGVRFSAKPDNVMVEYDQVEGDVDSVPVHWNVQAAFTLQEMSLPEWGVLSQQGYSVRAATVTAGGINGANIVDSASGRVMKFGARFTFDKQDPTETVLKDYLLIYKVASLEGVETNFDKRTPTTLATTLKGLADPDRPRGKRFYQFMQETAIGT